MLMRSLQPKYARHLMGFSHTDIKALIEALYAIEEGISRGLWSDSSPSDSKGKRSLGGQRPGDVGTISTIGPRPFRGFQTIAQNFRGHYSPTYEQYTSSTSPRPMAPTYLYSTPQPVYATQVTERPPTGYPRPRAP